MTPRRFTVTESREAMLVSADNLDEVAAWCGGRVYDRHDEPSVGFPSGRTWEWAFTGRVIVKDRNLFRHMSADEFERQSAGWEEQT